MRGIEIFQKPSYREIRPMRDRPMRGPPVLASSQIEIRTTKNDWTLNIVRSNTNSDPAHIKEKISIQNWIFVQFSISRLLLPPKPARNQPGVSRICTIMPQALGNSIMIFPFYDGSSWWKFLKNVWNWVNISAIYFLQASMHCSMNIPNSFQKLRIVNQTSLITMCSIIQKKNIAIWGSRGTALWASVL